MTEQMINNAVTKNDVTIMEQSKFFLPLALTSIVIIITHSLFNAGLARLPSPEVMIAAFAVAKSLMHILQSPVMMFRQAITALVDHRKNLKNVSLFMVFVVSLVVVALFAIAFTGMSRWIFREIMGLNGQTLDEAVLMLHILAIFPLMVSIRDFFAAFSIKFRTTPLITLASIIRITYVFIFIMFIEQMSAFPAAYLASMMFMGAVTIEAVTMAAGTWILSRSIPKTLDEMDRQMESVEPAKLSYMQITRFYSPLIATTVINNTMMPIINGGLARTDQPDMALSVFAVAWGLGMIMISPFMAFHQVPLNFMDETNANAKSVQKFALILASFSALMLIILSFTNLGYLILRHLIGASHQVSVLSGDVLKLMIVIPFLVVAREYYWGILMKRRTTSFIWQGKAINLVTLIIVIVIMNLIGPANPAINGAIGIIFCELSEFLYLYSVSRRGRKIIPA